MTRDEGDTSGGSKTVPSSSIRISNSWSHLLQKPPRLVLSRLERKVNIVHEITILETEEWLRREIDYGHKILVSPPCN